MAPQGPWAVDVTSAIFRQSVRDFKAIYPDVEERVFRFIKVKSDDPLNTRYGNNDAPMSSHGPFAGYMHAHLAPDLLILYTLKNRTLNLVALCQHADTEGKRAKNAARRFGL